MPSEFARPKLRPAPAHGPAIRAVRDGFATLDVVAPWDDVSRVLADAGAACASKCARGAHG
jgi:hypothetical protein